MPSIPPMTKKIDFSRLPERGEWLVVCEEKDYLVVAKGAGLPCAPLKDGAFSLFESVSASFPELLAIHGKKEGEGGLLHRIDTETCGLVLLARNDAFFSHIMESRKASAFGKTYTAYTVSVNGALPENQEIRSRFRPFGKKGAAVRPVFDDDMSGVERASTADKKKAGNRVYSTQIIGSSVVCREKGNALVRISCTINEGFRHQVRSHLAYKGFPVLGDSVYGGKLASCEEMQFYASGLCFTEADGTNVCVTIPSSVMDEKAGYAFRTFLTSLTR